MPLDGWCVIFFVEILTVKDGATVITIHTWMWHHIPEEWRTQLHLVTSLENYHQLVVL